MTAPRKEHLSLYAHTIFENKNVTLLNNLDTCATVTGSKTLKAWILSPLESREKIIERQQAIQWLTKKLSVKENFKGIGDLAHTATRISLEKCNHRQLYSLSETIEKIFTAGIFLDNSNQNYIENAVSLFKSDELQKIKKQIRSVVSKSNSQAYKESFHIKSECNNQLDAFATTRITQQELISLEIYEREETKISSLKIGNSSIHGHYIEVSSNFKNKVPERYRRKQTLKNGERFDTNELREIDSKLSEVDMYIEKLEQQIFLDLCAGTKKIRWISF